MLESFRKIPRWILGVMLLAVSVSFIFWGVGDMLRIATAPHVATVGDHQVSPQEFQREFNRTIRDMSAQMQSAFTTQQAKELGLDRTALEQLLTKMAIATKASDLGLYVSQSQVVDYIKSAPGMADANGNINPQALQSVLRRLEISEATFIDQVKGDIMRQQLMGSVLAGVKLPQGVADALQRFRLERRVAEYVLIEPSRAGEIKDPDDATLKAFYESRAADLFTAPEYRAVTFVSISAAEVGAKIDVSDEDIKKDYDTHKANYETPEKRRFEQIKFPTEAKAREAYAAVMQGKTFEDVAKEAGFKLEDTKIGELSRGDRTLPDSAFALELNKPSEPLKGLFGWVIVRATAVTPGTVKPLEEVRQEIRDRIATERAKDQLNEITNNLDDALGGGSTIEEAAAKVKLTAVKVAAIDANGKNEAGTTVDNLPASRSFLPDVFASDTAADPEVKEGDGGVSYVFRIDNVKPSAKKPFESVRAQVLTAWREEEEVKRLKAFADGLLKRAQGGETMDAIATSLGVAPLKSDPISLLGEQNAVLSQAVIQDLFKASPGGFVSGPVASGKSLVVARLDSIQQQAEPADAPMRRMYEDRLNQAFVGDIAMQFTHAVESDVGVTIDETEFNKLHTAE